jgi:hypothetical protein
MPFKKLGGGRYEGPSGKTFNLAQVKLYYAGGEKFPGQKKAGGGIVKSAFTKGTGPVNTTYAEGGEVLQATKSRFLKTPNEFTTGKGVPQAYNKSGKGGEMSKLEGDSKSETPIKPRA